jgi:murein DD-endopeptidase MepM/ murein hydrolase activator NlpD
MPLLPRSFWHGHFGRYLNLATSSAALLLISTGLIAGLLAAQIWTDHQQTRRTKDAIDPALLVDRLEIILARQTEIELRHQSLVLLSREAEKPSLQTPPPELRRQSPQEHSQSNPSNYPSFAQIEWAAAAIEAGLDQIEAEQQAQLEALAQQFSADRKRLARHWAALGLDPYRRAPAAQAGLGGPYIPPAPGDGESPFHTLYETARQDFVLANAFRNFANHVPLGIPLASDAEIVSGFGVRRDPFTRGMAMHGGVDFREEPGAPVRATAAGRVIEADWNGGYGRMVEIDHGGGLVTRYAHLSRLSVKPGERITRGQIIGRVGSTGRSTGPHLHYETLIDGKPVNPMRFLRAAAPINRYR